jgi:uncharacterized membrane protein YphA (DoxX/SURF4 family)
MTLDRSRLWDLTGLAARLVLGGVWIVAGWLKLPDPAGSVRAVRAYRLLPESIVPTVGHALPLLELAIGLLLVAGLAVRVAASVSLVLLTAFLVGIASAWTRGLQIDCGCFGGGGEVGDATAAYPWDLARDVGLAIAAAFLVIRPASALSLDRVLGLTPTYAGSSREGLR